MACCSDPATPSQAPRLLNNKQTNSFSLKCRWIISPNSALVLLILSLPHTRTAGPINYPQFSEDIPCTPAFVQGIPNTLLTPTHPSKPSSAWVLLKCLPQPPFSSGIPQNNGFFSVCHNPHSLYTGLLLSPCPALGLARSRHPSMTVD